MINKLGGNYVQQIILAQEKHRKMMRIDKNKSQGGMSIALCIWQLLVKLIRLQGSIGHFNTRETK